MTSCCILIGQSRGRWPKCNFSPMKGSAETTTTRVHLTAFYNNRNTNHRSGSAFLLMWLICKALTLSTQLILRTTPPGRYYFTHSLKMQLKIAVANHDNCRDKINYIPPQCRFRPHPGPKEHLFSKARLGKEAGETIVSPLCPLS